MSIIWGIAPSLKRQIRNKCSSIAENHFYVTYISGYGTLFRQMRIYVKMLDHERIKTTYSEVMSPGGIGAKSVGTSVIPVHSTVVPVHVQSAGQASVPLLCQSTKDTMNGQTIIHMISL
jgi:hypothetical protein